MPDVIDVMRCCYSMINSVWFLNQGLFQYRNIINMLKLSFVHVIFKNLPKEENIIMKNFILVSILMTTTISILPYDSTFLIRPNLLGVSLKKRQRR